MVRTGLTMSVIQAALSLELEGLRQIQNLDGIGRNQV